MVGVNFAGDEKVISVSEEGNVILFNISLNETNLLTGLFGFKVSVTCMSVCPHASWLSAFGLKNGLVVVADLRSKSFFIFLGSCTLCINIYKINCRISIKAFHFSCDNCYKGKYLKSPSNINLKIELQNNKYNISYFREW